MSGCQNISSTRRNFFYTQINDVIINIYLKAWDTVFW